VAAYVWSRCPRARTGYGVDPDMYRGFFQIDRQPFSMTPDPAFLFLTPKHREALAGLLFAVTSRKGFVVVTGDAGTGKTTLLGRLLRSVPPECAQFSFVLHPTLTPAEFLELAMLDFGLGNIPSSKAQRLMRFQQFLLEAHRAGKAAVLVVDEAHKLSPELLEEIRLLTNFETAEQKLLQIILAGQTELSAVLDRPDLRQLKQRIAVRLRIDALRAEEVAQYMESRWTRAGAKAALPFRVDAIHLIAQASNGIPRVINAICDNALTNAFGDNAVTIDARRIADVLSDLHIPAAGIASAVPQNGTPARISQPLPAVPASAPVVVSEAFTFKSLERYMPGTVPAPKRWSLRWGVSRS
jgi:general secretion pathway protein A